VSTATLLSIASDVYGDRLALGRRSEGVTYAELLASAQGGARVLHDTGAKSVVYIGVNGPEVPTLLFASALAGVTFVPLNYRLSADGLRALIDQLEDPLILADADHVSLARQVTDRVQVCRDWLGTAPADPEDVDFPSPDEGPAVLLFTSGTSSAPKGVVLRHEQLVSYVLQTVELASADESEAILVSVPPYHVAGIGTILTNVYGGRRMVYLPDFDPALWLALVDSEAITNAMVVPTMLARIVEHLDGLPASSQSLQALAYGGARMPPTVLERAMQAFPGVGFVNAYGLTETSSTIALLGPEDHRQAFGSEDPSVRARLGSVGRLVPGMEGQLRDDQGAILTAPDQSGHLWVRGAQVSGEYSGTGSVLDEEGWFPTHDLAHFDDDGYLYVEGRADDTIIRGGENIAPAEIEDVLERHPEVRDVAVLGLPDEEWGQRIVAVVVPVGPAIDPEDIREYVRARLRGSRTPDQVVMVGELPYGPTGKLLRRELVRTLSDQA
jgi:acyl-CoA synthetase (AMP-forming)/AMP-acid ligase II